MEDNEENERRFADALRWTVTFRVDDSALRNWTPPEKDE